LAKYNQKLEDLLDHHLIANEELEKKKQPNGIGYLLNGNMCLGIYEDMLMVRIGDSLAKTLLEKPGIHPYLPDDGLYDDFIMIEEAIYKHSKALQKFIDKSISYTRQLPPKEHKSDQLDS
jgi:TfoX/Sxy family transcriptional regulator of competence genes